MSAASLFYIVEVPDEVPADQTKPPARLYAEARTRQALLERTRRLNAKHKASWPYHYEVLGAHAAHRQYHLQGERP